VKILAKVHIDASANKVLRASDLTFLTTKKVTRLSATRVAEHPNRSGLEVHKNAEYAISEDMESRSCAKAKRRGKKTILMRYLARFVSSEAGRPVRSSCM